MWIAFPDRDQSKPGLAFVSIEDAKKNFSSTLEWFEHDYYSFRHWSISPDPIKNCLTLFRYETG